MALPELVKKIVEDKLAKYCEQKIPVHARDEIKLSYKFHGNTVFLVESRPVFLGEGWTHMKIAKFKYDPRGGTWELFCADRNDRWYSYFETSREKNFQALLDAVEEDATGIFWG
jgi:hypothetical protein